MRETLTAANDYIKQKWNALMERLRRSRSEARICARLDKLEERVCDRLAELEAYIDGRLAQPEEPAPVFVPEEAIPLGPISVPIGDGSRIVEFQGTELSQRFYAEGLDRITETLYGTGHGRYLVHARTLHRGKGLRTEFDLREIDEGDLREGGKYATLWRLHQPISLEEALEEQWRRD